MSKREIFYIGVHNELADLLQQKFGAVDQGHFEYSFKIGQWEELLTTLEKGYISLIFIDFSSPEFNLNQCLNYITLIKSHEGSRSTPLIGIFSSKENFLEYQAPLSFGINYFFLIGGDFNQFFGNIYYMAFEDDSHSMEFAHAKGFNCNSSAKHAITVSDFNASSLTVNSDIQIPDEIEMKFNFFSDFTPKSFELTESLPPSLSNQSFHTDKIAIHYSEGWDIENEETPFFEDTFSSWIIQNEEDSEITNLPLVSLHLFSSKLSIFSSTLKELNFSKVRLNLFSQFKEQDYTGLQQNDLSLFFIQDEKDLNEFDKYMCFLSEQELEVRPIVIILNHPSKVEALKKMYSYDLILSPKDLFKDQKLSKMIEMIQNKKEISSFYRGIKLKTQFSGDLPLPIEVTSLTENEITFKTEIEIPFYSILTIDAPLKMFLVVVPEFKSLSINTNGFHYMAIIMGLEESERQNLRKSVNFYLAKPPTKWEELNFQDLQLEEEKGNNDANNNEEDKKESKNKSREELKNSHEKRPSRLRSKNYKSKL